MSAAKESPGNITIQLTKGCRGAKPDRVMITASGGCDFNIEFKPYNGEIEILLARYAVEHFMGLKGVLHHLGQGDDSGSISLSGEALQAEIVTKVLMDARYTGDVNPAGVRDTALMLLREMNDGSPKMPLLLSAAHIASCLVFLERSLCRWEALPSEQTFTLMLT